MIALVFSLWAATRPRMPRRHDAALRLWRQHEPGGDAPLRARRAALGIAKLPGHRFVITADGYASVEPARRDVHGVLWRITPRDRVLLDAWENVEAGLYRAATLPVTCAGRRRRRWSISRGRAGKGGPSRLFELVLAAAREWNLPEDYIGSLQAWAAAAAGADARKIGEFR